MAGKLETDGTGTLETEDPGADVGGCGRLIHNHSQEVFFTVQVIEHFLCVAEKMSPTRTSSPNKAESGQRFIPE